MPHYCIVPECSNNSETSLGFSLYRLPLTKPALLKIWLIKICRVNTPLKPDLRVCGTYFFGGRKQSAGDVPEIFAWIKPGWRPPKVRGAQKDDGTVQNINNGFVTEQNNSAVVMPRYKNFYITI